MIKCEFIRLLKQDNAELFKTRRDAENSLEAVLIALKKIMISGENIKFINFGSFEIVSSEARKGVNPHNGEAITIPAQKRIRFKIGKEFKRALNPKD